MSRTACQGLAVLIALAALAVSCNGKNRTGLNGPDDKPPPFPGDFEPPPPLAEPDPPPGDKFGLAYLQQVYPRIRDPWTSFLEDCRLRLPPDDPLNNSALSTSIELAIGRDGSLQAASVARKSGTGSFDQAAMEIIREASPFPEPPVDLVSDDEVVHVTWLFARDRRQAGVATVELRRVEWPVERSVPKFLASGDIAIAAARLDKALAANPAGNKGAYVDLGRHLAVAAIREALRSEDVNVQRIGVSAAAAGKVLAAAPELRAIIDNSMDVALRGEAIAAVGTIGDEGAGQLLIEILETAKGSGVGGKADNSAAAARALARIGKREVAESTVLGWLNADDDASRWAGLVTMSEFPVPDAVPILAGISADRKAARPSRRAACIALGTSTTRQNAGAGMKALRKGFSEPDASVRAACAEGVWRAARAGVRSRLTYWKVVELLKKDRDERVRASASLAAAYLEPDRFEQEMYLLRKERSKLVLGALAESLGVARGPLTLKKLLRLATSDDQTVRRRAAASLARRPEPRARQALAALIGDADPAIRVLAVGSLDDADALSGLLGDPAPDVRTAAFAAIVRKRGKLATLPRVVRAIIDAEPGTGERARWAMSWLLPNARP